MQSPTKIGPELFLLGDMAMGLHQDGKLMPTTARQAGQQNRLTSQNLVRLTQRKALRDAGTNTLGAFINLGGLISVGWMRWRLP